MIMLELFFSCLWMGLVIIKLALSYDLASWSEITPCNKIDKPLVVYRFTGNHYDVHSNVALIMTKL